MLLGLILTAAIVIGNKKFRALLAAPLLLLLLNSCSNFVGFGELYDDLEQLILSLDFIGAQELITTEHDKYYRVEDQLLRALDQGMIGHYAAMYHDSNHKLQEADLLFERYHFSEEERKLDTTKLNYKGEAFENIYTSLFGAINYYNINDLESALVDIRRLNEKFYLLEDRYKWELEQLRAQGNLSSNIKPKLNFHNSALARYIALLASRDTRDTDSYRIYKKEYEEAFNSQASIYNFPQPDLPRLRTSSQDKAFLNIIAFTGLGPYKEAVELSISPISGGVYISSEDENYKELNVQSIPIPSLGGFTREYKTSFPFVKRRESSITKISLLINNSAYPELNFKLLEDIGLIAYEMARLDEDINLSRTITKLTIKAIVNESVSGLLKIAGAIIAGPDDSNSQAIGDLAGTIGNIIINSSKYPDTRIANFLPAKAYVLEQELALGTYRIEIRYFSGENLVHTKQFEQEITAGTNFVESYYPK